MLAPRARGWERPQGIAELPEAVVTCLWAPAGGSGSLVTVGVYEADDAAVAALEQQRRWDGSSVGGVELHAALDDGVYHVEHAWAARDGRVVSVIGSQSDAAIPIAQAVVRTVLGSEPPAAGPPAPVPRRRPVRMRPTRRRAPEETAGSAHRGSTAAAEEPGR